MKATALSLVLILTVLAAPPGGATDEGFVFEDMNGQPQTIASYTGNGQWLVVMIWAHDCHVCNMEVENYAHFHATHADTGARVLGISLDGPAKRADAQAFIDRHDLPFPNLIGEPQAVMLQYMMLTGTQFRGTPSILLYDPDGELKAAQAGAVPTEAIEAFIEQQAAAASSG